MKLLIVDDDARIRKLIRGLVSTQTDEIFECSNGREAHESYAEHQPDWVTMDLRMPGIDGIAATRMIMTAFPTAKIIIVTTFESSALRADAKDAGACAYVLKENLTDLQKIIRSH